MVVGVAELLRKRGQPPECVADLELVAHPHAAVQLNRFLADATACVRDPHFGCRPSGAAAPETCSCSASGWARIPGIMRSAPEARQADPGSPNRVRATGCRPQPRCSHFCVKSVDSRAPVTNSSRFCATMCRTHSGRSPKFPRQVSLLEPMNRAAREGKSFQREIFETPTLDDPKWITLDLLGLGMGVDGGRAGFEPALGSYPKHAFQACDLNRSSTSP